MSTKSELEDEVFRLNSLVNRLEFEVRSLTEKNKDINQAANNFHSLCIKAKRNVKRLNAITQLSEDNDFLLELLVTNGLLSYCKQCAVYHWGDL